MFSIAVSRAACARAVGRSGVQSAFAFDGIDHLEADSYQRIQQSGDAFGAGAKRNMVSDGDVCLPWWGPASRGATPIVPNNSISPYCRWD